MTASAECIVPGLTHCTCDPPRYRRTLRGTLQTWVYQAGRMDWIATHVRKCKACGMELTTTSDGG